MPKLPKSWDSWRSISTNKSDPKRLAKLIEAGFKLAQERKELTAQADAVGKELHELKSFVIKDFEKSELEEIKTKLGTARLAKKDIPAIDTEAGGWDKLWQFIVKNKAFELVQKRLGEKACQERWAEGEEIPGVKKFTKLDVKFGDAE